MESQWQLEESSPEVAKGGRGRAGAETGPRPVKVPRTTQARMDEYCPETLR